MARPRNPSAQPDTRELNREALEQDSHALTVIGQRSAEIAQRFDDQLPYDRSRVLAKVRGCMLMMANSMIEVGRALIVMKENETHGDFLRLAADIGIQSRTAQRAMAVALKCERLGISDGAVAQLGYTKMLSIVDEPDEEVVGFLQGETLAGITLAESQTMTVKEFEKRLKEKDDALADAKKTLTAKDRILAEKDDKLNKLAEAEHIRQHGTRDEREAAQIDELRAAGGEADAALMRLVATVDRITREAATESSELQARQTLDYVAQRLADLCASAGLHVDLLGQRVDPAWLAQIKQAAQSGAEEAPTRARRR